MLNKPLIGEMEVYPVKLFAYNYYMTTTKLESFSRSREMDFK